MNKKVLVRLAILVLVAAVGFLVLVFTAPEPPVSKRNFARIDGTMTEMDLTAFLGPANGKQTILARRAYDGDSLSFGVGRGIYGKTWDGQGQGIHVTFGEDGTVREAIYIRYQREENLFAKLKALASTFVDDFRSPQSSMPCQGNAKENSMRRILAASER